MPVSTLSELLTGLMVLPNKSMANIARCTLDSADKTNLSRFFSKARWFQEKVDNRRLRYLIRKTEAVRHPQGLPGDKVAGLWSSAR